MHNRPCQGGLITKREREKKKGACVHVNVKEKERTASWENDKEIKLDEY